MLMYGQHASASQLETIVRGCRRCVSVEQGAERRLIGARALQDRQSGADPRRDVPEPALDQLDPRSREGTREINTMIVGRAVTGLSAFV